MVKIFDLSTYYGIIRIQGARAAAFLQGQLSTNIEALTPKNHQFSAYCNLKGRIRALFRIWVNADSYYLQLPATILETTLTTLQQHGRFSKIKISDQSKAFFNIGFLFEKPLANDVADYLQQFNTSKVLEISDASKRFQVIGEAPFLEHILHTAKALESIDHWKLLNILAQIPEIEPQTIEQFLPHTLNLPALCAIDFKKGCFCGQEIIARMEYRNPQKRMLLCIKSPLFPTDSDGLVEPQAGDKLYAKPDTSQSIGTVINAVCSADRIEALIEVNGPDLPLSVYLEKTGFKKRFCWNIKP